MKTRRTIEGTSKGLLTEEAYTLSNPPRARLLGVFLHEPISDGDFKTFSIEGYSDKVRVLFKVAGFSDSDIGVAGVREFTLDNTAEGQRLGLGSLHFEFWRGGQLEIGWDGCELQVKFVSGFGAANNGDIILYEAF